MEKGRGERARGDGERASAGEGARIECRGSSSARAAPPTRPTRLARTRPAVSPRCMAGVGRGGGPAASQAHTKYAASRVVGASPSARPRRKNKECFLSRARTGRPPHLHFVFFFLRARASRPPTLCTPWHWARHHAHAWRHPPPLHAHLGADRPPVQAWGGGRASATKPRPRALPTAAATQPSHHRPRQRGGRPPRPPRPSPSPPRRPPPPLPRAWSSPLQSRPPPCGPG